MSDGVAFGGIGVVDNATAETTTDATPRQVMAFDIDGESNRMTNSAASGTITAIKAGTYDIQGHISFFGSLSKTFRLSVYKNTSPTGVPAERKLGTSGDIGATAFCAAVVLAAGDTISVWHWSTDGGTSFTAQHLSLSARRIK